MDHFFLEITTTKHHRDKEFKPKKVSKAQTLCQEMNLPQSCFDISLNNSRKTLNRLNLITWQLFKKSSVLKVQKVFLVKVTVLFNRELHPYK